LEKDSEEWLKIRCQAVQGRRLGSERIIQGIIDLAGNEYLTEPENKVKGKMDYWPGTLFKRFIQAQAGGNPENG